MTKVKPKVAKTIINGIEKTITIGNLTMTYQNNLANYLVIEISDDPTKKCQNSLEARIGKKGVEVFIRGKDYIGATIEGMSNIEDLCAGLSRMIEEIYKLRAPKQDSLF